MLVSYFDLKDFLEYGEDLVREFKPKFQRYRDEIGKTLCAYANDLNWVGGGYFFIGVDNNGRTIVNDENFDEFQQRIGEISRDAMNPNIAPVCRQHKVDDKTVFEVKVLRSISRPHRYRNVCYVRIGSTTRAATLEEERQISQSSIIPSWDNQPVQNSSIGNLDTKKFADFLRSTKPQEIFDTEREIGVIAENLDYVIRAGDQVMLKAGTILIFGDNPTRFFYQSKIQAVRFKGLDLAAPILSRQIFEGTLPELIVGARNFLEGFTSIASSFLPDEQERIDYLEYPHWAIREAIANAIVHRDYTEGGREVDIRMFDDRIEVTSPGGLGGGLTEQDLGTGKRYIRNHLVADTLNALKFIERAGTGIFRLMKEMEKNGSPRAEFQIDENTFTIILPAHPYYASQRFLEEANQEKSRANFTEARQLYERALERNRNNYYALTGLGDLELHLGNRDKAREIYRKAIDVQRQNSHGWISLAMLEEKYGNIRFARETYQEAVGKVPKNSVIYRNWAVMEWMQKNYKEADRIFELATRRDPNDSMTWYKWGQMDINSYAIEIKRKGEGYLRKAARMIYDDYTLSDIYFLTARAMPSLGYSAEETEEYFEKSLALNHNRGATHFYYAEFLQSIGAEDKARNHYITAKNLGFTADKRLRRRKMR